MIAVTLPRWAWWTAGAVALGGLLAFGHWRALERARESTRVAVEQAADARLRVLEAETAQAQSMAAQWAARLDTATARADTLARRRPRVLRDTAWVVLPPMAVRPDSTGFVRAASLMPTGDAPVLLVVDRDSAEVVRAGTIAAAREELAHADRFRVTALAQRAAQDSLLHVTRAQLATQATALAAARRPRRWPVVVALGVGVAGGYALARR